MAEGRDRPVHPVPDKKSMINIFRKIPSPILEEADSGNSEQPKPVVTYGELVIVGYNGFLPQGNKGRRRNKFVLCKRALANGVKKLRPNSSEAVLDVNRYLISYLLSRNHADIVEYTSDQDTDMFQIGRSSKFPIDFIVMETIPGDKTVHTEINQSTIEKFACRILCDRNNPEVARIYAAGFDTSKKIFLGAKSLKWREHGLEIDALTTDGVLIMHPRGSFCGGDATCDCWLETSVGGKILTRRASRSAQQRGQVVTDVNNVLQDGTLIDIYGATLLWRSAEGLANSPSKIDLEREIDAINAGRRLVIPRRVSRNGNQQQSCVHLACGHVQELHNLRRDRHTIFRRCNICMELGSVVKLFMGWEPAFYVDSGPPTFAFSSCGHMATERTVKYWARVTIPHGTNEFKAVCPFCCSPLTGSPGYIRLIY